MTDANHDSQAQDPFALARNAAAVIADRTGVGSHDVALVLGSGWAPAAEAFTELRAAARAAKSETG